MEVVIFDIEIIIDESGILVGIEESLLNSRLGILVLNEDGIDLDIFFDYGDDEENNVFGIDNFGVFNRKLWFLEIDRERLLLDLLIVFERDFRDSFFKSDIFDGKLTKEG